MMNKNRCALKEVKNHEWNTNEFKGSFLAQLEGGSEKACENHARHGAGNNQFGVGLGKLRGLAKQLKRNHVLALKLWNTGNVDAMILATMVMDAGKFSIKEIEEMIKPITYYKLIDEFVYNVVVKTNFADALGQRWIDSSDEFVGRAGWDIIIAMVLKGKTDGIDYDSIFGGD